MNITRDLLRKATTTVVILITWKVCKKHNNIIFCNKAASPVDLIATIKEEVRAWTLTDAKCFEHSIPCNHVALLNMSVFWTIFATFFINEIDSPPTNSLKKRCTSKRK